MVQPDGYHEEQRPERTVSKPILVVAGLALLVGAAVVLGDLTERSIPDIETTTTSSIPRVRPPMDPENFTVAAIETGRPLQWERVLETQEFSPLGLVEHESRLYLFATYDEATPRPASGGGLIGWVSETGEDWEPLGELVDRSHVVNNVVSTSKGLVALGADPDGGAVIWIAETGEKWLPNRLPTSTSSPPTRTWLSHAAAIGDRLIAVGSNWVDPAAILYDVIPGEIPGEISSEDLHRYGVGWQSPRGPIVVHGPLGLVAEVFTAEDLGMTMEELASILGSNDEPSTHVWTTEDGVVWEETALDVWGVQNLFSAPDGSLRAAGWGQSGLELWSSADGLAWEPAGTTSVDAVSQWGDSLVGIRHAGAVPDLALSTDGTGWEPMGVAHLFPKPGEVRGLQWYSDSLATGRAGVGFVAVGWREPMSWGVYEPVVLTKDGHTLTVDEVGGSLVLDDGVDEHRWTIQSQAAQDDIAVDLAAETITIIHPDTGDILLTVSFEDIDRATALQSATQQTAVPVEAFVFTADGEEWVIDDLTTTLGEHRRIADLEVTDSSVVALIGDDHWWGPVMFGATPSGADTLLEVWRAVPPAP